MNLWCAVRLSSAPRIDGSRSRRRLRGGGNGLAVSRRLLHLFLRLLFGCGKHRGRSGRSRGERREQNKVVLVATGAHPDAFLPVDGLDRRDHRARDRRGAEWCGGTKGEEKTAAGFGGASGQGVAAPRPKAKLLEEPSGSLETSAAEPAEELLRAVADEEQSNRC